MPRRSIMSFPESGSRPVLHVRKLLFLENDAERADGRQEATRGSTSIHLAPKEFAMLRLMADARGGAISRERFLDSVWGYSAFPTTRTVDNHIVALRRAIGDDPKQPRWLFTVRGIGYRLAKE